MRLAVHTDYALRMLMYLAVRDDGLESVEEIVQSYGISILSPCAAIHPTSCRTHLALARYRRCHVATEVWQPRSRARCWPLSRTGGELAALPINCNDEQKGSAAEPSAAETYLGPGGRAG